jgi:acyl carrier protein
MTDLRPELRSFVVENFMYGQDGETLGDETSFLESGIIDSTGVLELIGFLERQYRITLEPEELVPGNLDSIASLAGLVSRKLAPAAVGEAAPCK